MPTFFATCPKGLELLLVDELKQLGASTAHEKRAGVVFEGNLEIAYRACLWSRLANHILLPLKQFLATDAYSLYQGIQTISWSEHFLVTNTIAITFTSVKSELQHTQFGAQKVKDAIVDQFREHFGERPSVQREQPDIRINVHVQNNIATVSLDLSGESLHRRGYRQSGGAAPLKENLAAAILLRANWPTIAKEHGSLIDPMCGSGTLPIEAALMAADIAPGLLHTYYGFLHWRQHDSILWQKLLTEAEARRQLGLTKLPPIIGYDADSDAIHNSLVHIERAGLRGYLHIEKKELLHCTTPKNKHSQTGLLIVNPPYGERLGDTEQLAYLYRHIGDLLKTRFLGWQAGIFTGNPDLGKRMGLRARKRYQLFNGELACQLLCFHATAEWFVSDKPPTAIKPSTDITQTPLSPGAQMFANRLEKNLRQFKRWAEREQIFCYRIYDADLPDYAIAIDCYESWVHVQEYAAPNSIDPFKAETRLQEALAILPNLLNIPSHQVFLKQRKRQRGKQQYQKLQQGGEFYTIREYTAKFLINFTDYLDTGLFLDQRITRKHILELCQDKHFLNLFAYTGTATVYAALGGARSTTTVDMSATYLDWAKRNLALNGFSEHKHQFIQADCLLWLNQAKPIYDVIFLEPPTFSNSKRMEETLDTQRDHVELIHRSMQLLKPDGILIFATNKRNFKLDKIALNEYSLEDWSAKTLPLDFQRRPQLHHVWKIRKLH